jgi:hypothetical protein
MAAATAGVGKVALLPVTRGIEVERLAQAIDAPLQVQSFDALDPVVAENGNRTGLVLISPGTLRRDELDKVLHLLRVSPGPLLGLITYERERDPTTGLRPVFVRGRDEAKDAAGHVGDREPAS